MIGDLIEETIDVWLERPIRTILAFLLIGTLLVMMTIAGELIMACVTGIIALMLFIGGILLVFSIKSREYKNAAWMSGIAFFLLWDSDIIALKISFFSATGILELTAIAFILIGIFEEHHTKKYIYATIAFFYIVLTILSY